LISGVRQNQNKEYVNIDIRSTSTLMY